MAAPTWLQANGREAPLEASEVTKCMQGCGDLGVEVR